MLPYCLAQALRLRPRPRNRPRNDHRRHEGAGRACCPPRKPLPGRRVAVMGLDFPNPVGLAAGLDKNGDAHRRARRAGLRLHRDRHRHAAAAARQPQAAPVPPARGDRPSSTAWASTTTAWMRWSRTSSAANYQGHPRHQHRQELRHADREGRRRLPDLPAQGVCPRQLRHRQHLLAQHQEPAPAAGRRRTRRAARRTQGANRQNSPQQHGNYVPLALKIAPDLDDEQITSIADAAAPPPHRRRDRHQHHAVARRRRTPAARQGNRRPLRRAGVRESPPTVRERSSPPHSPASCRSSASAASPTARCAKAKIEAGAALVQIYTGLIYRGPELVKECVAGIR